MKKLIPIILAAVLASAITTLVTNQPPAQAQRSNPTFTGTITSTGATSDIAWPVDQETIISFGGTFGGTSIVIEVPVGDGSNYAPIETAIGTDAAFTDAGVLQFTAPSNSFRLNATGGSGIDVDYEYRRKAQ